MDYQNQPAPGMPPNTMNQNQPAPGMVPGQVIVGQPIATNAGMNYGGGGQPNPHVYQNTLQHNRRGNNLPYDLNEAMLPQVLQCDSCNYNGASTVKKSCSGIQWLTCCILCYFCCWC